MVWAITEQRVRLSTELRWVLLSGFMGAFTTFSTFVFDTEQLGAASRWGAGLGNMAFQNLTGLALLFVGLAIGRAL